VTKKMKLIEVAVPLDAINKTSAREKSISRGHLSMPHVWWGRFSLALSVNGGTLLGRAPLIPCLLQKGPDFRFGRVDTDLDESHSRAEARS
jgi:hypothetical protein